MLYKFFRKYCDGTLLAPITTPYIYEQYIKNFKISKNSQKHHTLINEMSK